MIAGALASGGSSGAARGGSGAEGVRGVVTPGALLL